MSNNKKHHYVPRFYLKRFSKDGKSICLYNLKSERKIINANLKNQCYKNHFYGEDQLIEHELSGIEGAFAALLRKIGDIGRPPPPYGSDHLLLLLFVAIQYGRTKHAADTAEEMMGKVMKALLARKAEKESWDLDLVNIGLKNPGAYALTMTVQNYPVLADLQYKLLKNCSSVAFITSDNPVALYNQFMNFRAHVSCTGLASKGLQIFFPIDPYNMILLYDPEVYRVGSDRKSVIEVSKNKDVYELNRLQACSCLKNIYFSDVDIDCKALHAKASQFLRKEKTNLEKFPGGKSKGQESEYLFTSTTDIRTNMTLSFVSIRASAKAWRNDFRKTRMQPAAVMRNKNLIEENKEFIEAVKQETYKAGDFFNFMHDKLSEKEVDAH